MADLVIGGNTHKGIIYLKVRKTDGTTAVFVDYANREKHLPSAAVVSVNYGEAFSLSASVKLGKPTANIKKET